MGLGWRTASEGGPYRRKVGDSIDASRHFFWIIVGASRGCGVEASFRSGMDGDDGGAACRGAEAGGVGAD